MSWSLGPGSAVFYRLHQLPRTGTAQMNEAEKPSQGTEADLRVTGSMPLRAKFGVLPNILNADIGPTCFVITELPREVPPCKRDIPFNRQMRETPVILQKCPIVVEPRGPQFARFHCVALSELQPPIERTKKCVISRLRHHQACQSRQLLAGKTGQSATTGRKPTRNANEVIPVSCNGAR